MNNRTKAKSGQVPTLTPDTLGGLVFKIAGWRSMQGPFYNTFHINRIEDVRQVMKFPMPPHRKTVIDFIFGISFAFNSIIQGIVINNTDHIYDLFNGLWI